MPDTTNPQPGDDSAPPLSLENCAMTDETNPDWRLVVRLHGRADVVFPRDATAETLAHYLQREGVLTGEATR